MEIGGQDITIKHRHPAPMNVATEVMYLFWPNVVTEWGETGQGRDEIFFFENEKAAKSWDKYGLTDDNSDQMIWLTFEPGEIHCVLKEGDSKSLRIINYLRRALLATTHD